ncbi:MAG: beta-ribofuranosylaminobenzene 5'-phosphate synthase family protein [Methylohalobius sp.]
MLDRDTSDLRQDRIGVRVRAPARLHLGFLDPGGYLGRRFGSIGVALETIVTEIEVTPAPALSITGHNSSRAVQVVMSLLKRLQLPDRVHIHIASQIPAHCGLGSGTQLALGLGVALARFWKRALDVRRIAWLSGRGERSGIGIAAFEGGGFIVDGGRAETTETPPLLFRLKVPESWRWLLVFDERSQGLSGHREVQAFRTLPPFPRATAAELCYQLMIRGLPAMAEGRFEDFCACLAEVQRANGEYFAPAQNGRYASQEVAQVLSWLEGQGWIGVGQSSWGPTGFCLLPDPDTAEQIKQALMAEFAASGLRFQVVKSRNRGAEIC